MGEIKQTNFRIDQNTADAFRKYCEENGMNQAQGFDHIMQVVEMDRAKAAVPNRITEIEGFEKSVKDIMAAYLYSIEVNQNAEDRIREQFASDLKRKDKTIDDLRMKLDQLQTEKENTEITASEAVKAKEQAEKDATAAEKVREAAEKTAEDKKIIADTLAAKLAEAEKKAEGFDELKEALKAAEQQIKDIKRNAEEVAKDTARTAEREKDEAVREVSENLQAEITALRDELRVSKSETDTAKRDAETARTAVIAELSQAHQTEISEIRKKLDDRTEELMQTRQQIGDLQIQLQAEQMKFTNLERQLKETLENSEA